MEVTKWLKPSESASRIGDGVSVQAVTRAEQAWCQYGTFARSPFSNQAEFGVVRCEFLRSRLR
jgi:hypothetical protein